MPDTNNERDLVPAKTYRIQFEPGVANLSSVMEAIKRLGGRHGCEACGRLGYIDLRFDERVNPREILGVRSIVDLETKTEIR